MSQQQDLGTINSSTLGASFPAITLPSGQTVQTGTVGALLANIREYDALKADESPDAERLQQLEAAMRAAVPMLKRVGMFELFAPEEWVGGRSRGREFVGKAASEGVGA